MGSAAGAAQARALRAQRASTLDAHRTAEAGATKVLLTGVDWLDLFSRVEPKPEVVKELRRLQQDSVDLEADGSAERAKWTSKAGIVFQVLPFSTRKKELLLESDVFSVGIKPDAPDTAPRVYLNVHNRALWDAGFEAAGELALELLAELNGDDDPQVSRIDICCDFMGWQPTRDVLDDITGRVLKRDIIEEPYIKTHGRGRRFTGFTFGGNRLTARWYDKSTELLKSGKLWFRPLWRKAGWLNDDDSGRVWRIEFQIRRDPLTKATVVKDDEESEVRSWSQICRALDSLWEYLTRSWLSYRLPRTADERVRIHPRWQIIQAARFTSETRGELHRYRLEYSLQKTIGAFAGYLKRGWAEYWEEQNTAPYLLSSTDDLAKLIARADAHYKEKHDGQTLFEAAVELHRQRQFLKRLLGGDKRRTMEAALAGAEA